MSPLPDAKSVRVNPSAAELKELAAKMPNAQRTRYGNLNVQTEVLPAPRRSNLPRARRPEASSHQAISRDEGERIAKLQDDYIAGQDMIVVDGFIGNDPEFRTAGPALHRGGQRQHRRHAAAALLRRRRRRTGSSRELTGHLHAQPEGRGLPERPRHRRRPRARRHPRVQLRLLRRVEEGRPAHVEQARLRPRRPAAARRLQGDPDGRRRQGRA